MSKIFLVDTTIMPMENKKEAKKKLERRQRSCLNKKNQLEELLQTYAGYEGMEENKEKNMIQFCCSELKCREN